MSYEFINAYNLATVAGNSRMELKEAEIANLMKLLEQTDDPLVKEMCEERIAQHYSVKVARYQKEKERERIAAINAEIRRKKREKKEEEIAKIHANGNLTGGEIFIRWFSVIDCWWMFPIIMDVCFYWIEIPLALIKTDFRYFGYYTQKYWHWLINS